MGRKLTIADHEPAMGHDNCDRIGIDGNCGHKCFKLHRGDCPRPDEIIVPYTDLPLDFYVFDLIDEVGRETAEFLLTYLDPAAELFTPRGIPWD